MITEPTLEQYIYYLRRIENDDDKAIRERRATFEKEIRALLAHLERLSGQTIPAWEWPEESESRRVSQCIVRTDDWLDNLGTGRSCFLEARTYGDVYWLQIGYYQEGETAPEIFASLRDEAWRPLAVDHLLGSSAYLCGIVADKTNELAAQSLAAYTGGTPGEIVATRLANCCAELYGSSRSPHVTALFYSDEECEEWAGRTILNDIAIRFELYKHKADRQLAWCEENFAILSAQEQSLRDLLEEAKETSQADADLLQRLIQLHRVFSGNLGMLVERQTTIALNLDNFDIVLEELKPLEDHYLIALRDRLRQRQRQLEADLTFADHAKQKVDDLVNALKVQLALDRLVELQTITSDATIIERSGWFGARPPAESEIEALVPHAKLAQTISYPQIEVPPRIDEPTNEETAILQRVYRGYDRVLIERPFTGGYSGTKVLLTLPVREEGLRAARKVTKLGPTLELRQELKNYERYVKPFLPFCAAGVERDEYYEQGARAGLNYYFVGGGALGQVMDLEQYYRSHTSKQIVKTLADLLDRELRQRWFDLATPLTAFFSAEYGRHIVEHLRLKLHTLWVGDRPSSITNDYERIGLKAIPRKYETKQPGALLQIEGLIVTRIKSHEIKLQDPKNLGTVVRVALDLDSSVPQGLDLGNVVGVCGKVIYNRRGRLEWIARAIFPDLRPGVDSACIKLPDVPRVYPNPLQAYPEILSKTLAGRSSYVHGDLHLRNILVDEWGKGWLIDFAKVTKRHILFDFIKLETYVRLMGLVDSPLLFSLNDYTLFEEALADATLNRNGATCPPNRDLQTAHQVILAIRRIARNCMARDSDFLDEYFPALFLYCLAVTKYYEKDRPEPTQLAFATASVLGRYLPEIREWPCLSVQSSKGEGESPAPRPTLGEGNRWAVLVGVNKYKDKAHYDRLHVCVNDAQALCEQLIAGGFDPDRVHLLTGKGAQSHARQPNAMNRREYQ